ncbi:PDZ domain-containing protein [Sphingomonas sp.]|uniref:M61 family metallopeptidase n=1 Tax=Sphingomonas sp. TaxID=28214 RepID=UPI0025EE0499|nr:PDZ domain-containing protein [Sphingomonas sp.]MBV9527855.1 M61 family metallopeptidase [Sphingomonas sp.]
MRRAALALLMITAATSPAIGQIVPPQNSKPQPTPKVDRIPPARDVAYPGTIQLTVDASDVTRAIFRVHEQVPVTGPGDLVLLYPQWLPGNHSPSGQINKVAGFRATAGGRELNWTRDSLDVYGFHVAVPEGVSAIDVDFQYLSPTAGNQGRVVATPDMASIEWIANSMYPAGYFVRDIPVQASVIVPTGWKVATALRPAAETGNRIDYPVTSYEILMDSPLIAGAHYRRFPLSPDVSLDVIADTEAELAAKPEQIAAHRRLVEQAVKAFGAQHYDHYDFLLTISDELGGEGLEHHRSSEDGTDRGYFTNWDERLRDRNLLPHEFSHSWDGKFRRGADLWTPDYRTKMEDSLLWVYEGQTQFWGYVLGARSGMLSKQDTLDAIASVAAGYSTGTPGRSWRALVDTTNDPIIAQRAPAPWGSWQRAEDYYSEGQLIWIDVDRIIREQSGGKRSIDDFARAFFGVRDRDYGELTYTFDDVVRTLNAVQPYDWRSYLQHRVYDIAPRAPLEGITKGGYRLVFTSEPTKWIKMAEAQRKFSDFTYSGGFAVAPDGHVASVLWGGPAYAAGLTIGSQVMAVNGRTFDPDALKEAIKAANGTTAPVALLIKQDDVFRTVNVDWHGGLRYPRLVKAGTGRGTLDALLTPR